MAVQHLDKMNSKEKMVQKLVVNLLKKHKNDKEFFDNLICCCGDKYYEAGKFQTVNDIGLKLQQPKIMNK
eukprot:Pgem_evm1s15693